MFEFLSLSQTLKKKKNAHGHFWFRNAVIHRLSERVVLYLCVCVFLDWYVNDLSQSFGTKRTRPLLVPGA